MTLDTRVYVHDRIDHRELFAKCNQLIGSHEGIQFTDKEVATGERWIYNHPGQGLCALLDVRYRPEEALYATTSHEDYCEPDCDYHPHSLLRWSEVSFDTAYSYNDGGCGCGDLHARLVAELGQWLDGKGIRWSWKNGFTGEIHERYDGLLDLGSDGAEASMWYRDIVAPALGLPS